MELRKHQKKMHKLLLKSLKKNQHVFFQASTGFGKSVNIHHLVDTQRDRIIVMAPRRKLIEQLMETLEEFEPACLVPGLQTGDPQRDRIIVTTPQTLNARLKKNKNAVGKNIAMVVIDEAHIGFNMPEDTIPTGISMIHEQFWNSTKWVGFTATPITAQGYRLEGWDHTVSKYSTAWLIEKGWLAEFDYYARPAIDMSGYRVQSTGDYSTSDLEAESLKHAAIESVIKHWNHYSKGGSKKTMIFAASINHAEALAESIEAVIVHSKMSDKDLEDSFRIFQNGTVPTIISVDMLTTGFDDSSVEVQILARGTASLRLAIQMWGRVLRPHPAIPRVTIVDLAGVYESVGMLPNETPSWNKVKGETGEKEPNMQLCPDCHKVTAKADCDREVTDELIIYSCPHCQCILEEVERGGGEKQFDEVDEVQLIKTLSDLDRTITYSHAQYVGVIDRLRDRFTKSKPGWTHYIVKTCTTTKQSTISTKEILAANMQGIYSDGRAWKALMDVYEENKDA